MEYTTDDLIRIFGGEDQILLELQRGETNGKSKAPGDPGKAREMDA